MGWAKKFEGANWAYLPGQSGLAVVDCDSAIASAHAEKLFGPTLIVIESGSGNGRTHRLYRTKEPLRSIDLRRYGFDGEIKSANTMVVGPGSIHPETGQPYLFRSGSFDDLKDLPPFDRESLKKLTGQHVADWQPDEPKARNPEGRRNDYLFLHLRRAWVAGQILCEDDAIALGREYNRLSNDNSGPRTVTDTEVIKTAKSVWKGIVEGKCRAPAGDRAINITDLEIAALETLGRAFSDALVLLHKFRREHTMRTLRGEPFAIACTAMASQETIPGWTDRKKYLKARNSLLDLGLVRCVLPARGKLPGQYMFGGVQR